MLSRFYLGHLPRGPGTLYRRLETLRFLLTRDREAILLFLRHNYQGLDLLKKIRLISRFLHTTNHVRAYHTQAELITAAHFILKAAEQSPKEPIVVVEAGAGKGASTAKLSATLDSIGSGHLHVFDSFKGIPRNSERLENIDGRRLVFKEGAFLGRLASVKRVVSTYGAIDRCTFYKGVFADTVPQFKQSIDMVLLDVDLLSSTDTCIRGFFPMLKKHGVMLSQDGHIKQVVQMLSQRTYWEKEVGVSMPVIEGLGINKLLVIRPN